MTGPTRPGLAHVPTDGGAGRDIAPAACIHPSRREALRYLACLPAAGAFPVGAHASGGKPCRVVVGFAAGSAPDVAARIVVRRMQDILDVPMVVDNKPGAGGLLATQDMLRAAPDGNTLLLCGVNQVSIAQHAYQRLPYDPSRDLAPIAIVNEAPLVLVAGSGKMPATTLAEYLAWAAQRKPLFMGTLGIGTMAHFDASVLGRDIGHPPELIHYRASGDALAGLTNGDVHGMFASPAFATAQVRGGRLRAFATTSPTRLPMLPEVPTMREQGRPQLELNAWFGLFAPAATPAATLDRLGDAAVRAVSGTDGAALLEQSGFRAVGTGRGEIAAFLRSEDRRWARIVADTGFRADP